MSGREDDDEDPTGIQSLLSQLPDPEHRREALVARISSSLADEERTRGESCGAHRFDPSLQQRRSHRWRLLTGLGAAGVLIVAAGWAGITFLASSESLQTAAAALARTGAGVPAVAEAHANYRLPTPTTPAHPLPVSLATGTLYTRQALPAQAASMAGAAHGAAAVALPSSPLRSSQGMAECLRAVGVKDAPAIHVDLATFEGAPAAVIVTATNTETKVLVVKRDCGTGSSLLHGPLDLPAAGAHAHK